MSVHDVFVGHRWLIGHHIEDVAADETQRRSVDRGPACAKATARQARRPYRPSLDGGTTPLMRM